MPTLFISDLHLTAERPRITALFLNFLGQPARAAEALYILGDLFEAWLGDDAPQPADMPVLEALRALTQSGVPVFFMHGNRDFLVAERFASVTGCRLLADPTRIDLYGEPTLLMHGDLLCTDDHDYQRVRAVVRDPQWQARMLALAPAQRAALAQQFRAESEAKTAGKAEAIMDVNQAAVLQTMRFHGVHRLIHGHTHRPAIHRFELDGVPATRWVLADWHQRASALECDAEGCRTRTWG